MKKLSVLLTGLSLVISSMAFAAPSKEKVGSLLELSGFTSAIQSVPNALKGGLMQANQQGADIPQEKLNGMVSAVDSTIKPNEMIANVKDKLAKSLTEEEVDTLLDWYGSDDAKKIVAAEAKANTPEGYQAMVANAQSLMGNEEMVNYAVELDQLLGLTDLTMEMQNAASVAVYTGIMSSMEPEAEPNMVQIRAQVEAESAQARPQIQQFVVLSQVYSYQDIDQQLLDDYKAFLKTDVAQKFVKLGFAAISPELEKSVLAWSKTF